MAQHNDLGKLGEEIAENFIIEKGYQILQKNWKWDKAEIDFIAKNQEVLLFIEVKTRQNATFGYPEDAVGKKKEKMIFEAAAAYMDSISHEQEIRFDILTVTMEPKSKIEYFADAFFPLW
jgi:putative endonuclease